MHPSLLVFIQWGQMNSGRKRMPNPWYVFKNGVFCFTSLTFCLVCKREKGSMTWTLVQTSLFKVAHYLLKSVFLWFGSSLDEEEDGDVGLGHHWHFLSTGFFPREGAGHHTWHQRLSSRTGRVKGGPQEQALRLLSWFSHLSLWLWAGYLATLTELWLCTAC